MSKVYIPNPDVWKRGDSYPGFPYAVLTQEEYDIILECRALEMGREAAQEMMCWIYVEKQEEEVEDASD